MHHVLLAVDGSKASLQAAWLLARLPYPSRYELTVARIIEVPPLPNPLRSAEVIDRHYRQEKYAAAETLAEVSAMFDGARVRIDNIIDRGPVGERLVQIGEQIGADLIVVGATGRSQISRILLGSVSDHVATHARCSVLVVRPRAIGERDQPLEICMAYQKDSPLALREIADIRWWSSTRLHVLSVLPFSEGMFAAPRDRAEVVGQYEADLDDARLQLAAVAPAIKMHLAENEHVGEEIVRFAEQRDIDVLVVGETQRDNLPRFLLGSTSRYVLRHAPCSVWIGRPALCKTNPEVSPAIQQSLAR
ncbi:universal stress protein [Roseimaritima ulvae]|uniref:Universal stress protein n=1 Tax=Roseimaritima ulvae TaxID=980254 RepID=A0A5B9R072_9BACT|nr:universal stress protein [Roseimaritima ulvae]QEG39661.1 Putative universal stress protein [Roseimaritima ulvae]